MIARTTKPASGAPASSAKSVRKSKPASDANSARAGKPGSRAKPGKATTRAEATVPAGAQKRTSAGKLLPIRKVSLQTRVAPGAAYKRVCDIALSLPGVEQSTSYGTPSLKVKGKIMSRLRTEAEGALALRCDFLDRQILLQADPEAFFLTDHYLNYPMILVRLDKVRRGALPDLIQRAWRLVAPPKLVADYDGEGKE